jgi:predicted nucleic acid-binding protein
MTDYFFDSSALAKRYLAERGSGWVRGLLNPSTNHIVWLAQITKVELASALARRVREGNLQTTSATTIRSQLLVDLQNEYLIVALSEQILEVATDLLFRYPLRAFDAIQLASALEAHQSVQRIGDIGITFVSNDQKLLSVAQQVGLPIEDPNAYP